MTSYRFLFLHGARMWGRCCMNCIDGFHGVLE